jgi:hypothetical protein
MSIAYMALLLFIQRGIYDSIVSLYMKSYLRTFGMIR